jgi:hypothetical protein
LTKRDSVPDPQNPSATITAQTDVVLSDAGQKVFLLHNRFGISTYGAAFVNNLPIAHHIEVFQAQSTAAPNTVQNLADGLLKYFRAFQPIPETYFFVTGYDTTIPFVFALDVSKNKIERTNADPKTSNIMYGILRGGDTAIVNRLLSQPQFNPPFQLLNVQDAVDYSRHFIRTTIDQMRFEPRFPTVGGPIDTLVITSNAAQFAVKKPLTVNH